MALLTCLIANQKCRRQHYSFLFAFAALGPSFQAVKLVEISCAKLTPLHTHNLSTRNDGFGYCLPRLRFAVKLICVFFSFTFSISIFSLFFICLFFFSTLHNRQSSTICWIDCGACKCSNHFGNIIWTLLCDLWTVKSWLRLHKNPGADDMSGCMGGCCNFYKVINSFFFSFFCFFLFLHLFIKQKSAFTNHVCI